MVAGCQVAGLTPGRVAKHLSREIPDRDVAEALLLDALPAKVDRFMALSVPSHS